MMTLRPRAELGGGDFGWLRAKHHFAVDVKGNPAHGPLGSLIVWNDDQIAPGGGFPLHGHRDMEIVTYVRRGTVSHSDSVGNRGRIEAGQVQAMTAGTGIRHAEINAGEEVLQLFQIWLLPNERGLPPRWETRPFPKADRADRFVVLASGFGGADAIAIRSDASVLGATVSRGRSVSQPIAPHRHAYLVPAIGNVRVNGMLVSELDGVAMYGESQVEVEALETDVELVLVVAD
jgi:quercetin 2,3-dioxygenase